MDHNATNSSALHNYSGLPECIYSAIICLFGGLFNVRLIFILLSPSFRKFLQTRLGPFVIFALIMDTVLLGAFALLHIYSYAALPVNFGDKVLIFSAFVLDMGQILANYNLILLSFERLRAFRVLSMQTESRPWLRSLLLLLGLVVVGVAIAVAYQSLIKEFLLGAADPSVATRRGFILAGVCLFYYIPLAGIAIIYGLIAFRLRRSAAFVGRFEHQVSVVRRRRAVVVLALVFSFAILYFPYQFYCTFMTFYTPSGHIYPAPSQAWGTFRRVSTMLSMSQSAVGPLILCFLSENVSRKFLEPFSLLKYKRSESLLPFATSISSKHLRGKLFN